MEEKYISCAICGKVLQSLIFHLKSHNISCKEYKEKFPGTSLVSPYLKQRASVRFKALLARPDMREKMKKGFEEKRLRGYKFFQATDEETKRKRYTVERNRKISETLRKRWANPSQKMIDGIRRTHQTNKARGSYKKRRNQNKLVISNYYETLEKIFDKHNIHFVKDFAIDKYIFDYYLFEYNALIMTPISSANLSELRQIATKERYLFFDFKNDDLSDENNLLKKINRL